MHLLMVLSTVLFTVCNTSAETIANNENEVTVGNPVRRLIGILAIPTRNRRQSEDVANKFEDDGYQVVSPQLFVIGLAEPGRRDELNFDVETLRSPEDIQIKRKKRSPVFQGGVRCYDCGMTGGISPVGGVNTMEGGRSGSWSQSSSSASSGSYGSDYGGVSQRTIGRK